MKGVKLAKDTKYGLAAVIWTENVARANRFFLFIFIYFFFLVTQSSFFFSELQSKLEQGLSGSTAGW